MRKIKTTIPYGRLVFKEFPSCAMRDRVVDCLAFDDARQMLGQLDLLVDVFRFGVPGYVGRKDRALIDTYNERFGDYFADCNLPDERGARI
jgi:hypothetical protein